MTWTVEGRIDLLKKLWAEGIAISKIAAKLGDGITRNAVIGKVHRLGLVLRGSPIIRGDGGLKIRRINRVRNEARDADAARLAADALKRVEYVAPTDGSEPKSRGLLVVDLTSHTCHWPHGDPKGRDFGYCGHNTTSGSKYCAHHHSRVYRPQQTRYKGDQSVPSSHPRSS